MKRIIAATVVMFTLVLAYLPLSAPAATVLYGHSVGGVGQEWMYSVECDPTGNIYLAGSSTNSEFTECRAYLAVFAPDGALMWDMCYTLGSWSYFLDIALTPTGEIYCVGWSDAGSFVAKLSSTGSLLWSNHVTNYAESSIAYAAYDYSTGGVIVTGGGVVMALFPDGNVNWCAWPASYLYLPQGVVTDTGGNAYVVLMDYDTYDMRVVVIDSTGTVTRAKALPTTGVDEWGYDIAFTSDGDLICLGEDVTNSRLLISRLDTTLKSSWDEYVSSSEDSLGAWMLASSPDGSAYTLTGNDWIIHTASNGNVLEASKYPEPPVGLGGGPEDIVCMPTGGLIACGNVIGRPSGDLIDMTSTMSIETAKTNWVNEDTSVWTNTVETSSNTTMAASDPEYVVDDFDDESLSYQAWYGVIDPPKAIDVSILYSTAAGSTVVDLYASVTGGTGTLTYRWSFGDSAFGFGEYISHDYLAPGVYYTQVSVEDGLGAFGYNYTIVRIEGPPEIESLTYSPVPGFMPVMEGIPISFNVVAEDPDEGPLSYTWDFGDGNVTATSTSTIEHEFALKGNYTVNVTVTDDELTSAWTTVNITILENVPPSAYIYYWPDYPRPGQDIQFNQYSSDPDDTIVSYLWDFGDNTTSTNSWDWHAYAAEGVYNVTLTVTDEGGKSGVAYRLVTVLENWPPQPDWWLSPSPPSANESVMFDAHQSRDPDGSIVSFLWDFGDGTTGSEMYEWHTFANGGYYNVTLTCVDDDGLTANLTRMIYVNYQPVASFTVSPAYLLQTKNVTFDASASYDIDGNVLSYIWQFGGNWTAWVNDPIFNVSFPYGGDIHVTLTVNDDLGAQDSTSAWIYVDWRPTARAGADVYVDPGTTVELNGSLSYDDFSVENYTWWIPDLSVTMYGMVCNYTFDTAGVYYAMLVVRDNMGQNSTPDYVLINVTDISYPVAEAGPDIWVLPGENVTLDGRNSTDDGPITQYIWTFIYNGTTVTLYGPVVTIDYLEEGVYNITLTVIDSTGKSDTDCVIITVSSTPIPEFGPMALLGAVLSLLAVIAAFMARRRVFGAAP